MVLMILNVSFVFNYANENQKFFVVTFPNGTDISDSPGEKLVQLRMQGAIIEEVSLISIIVNTIIT